MSASSVRIALRRGQKLDLDIQEVPQLDCRLNVHAEPGDNDRLHVCLSFEVGRVAEGAEGKPDVPAEDAAPSEDVREGYWHAALINAQGGLTQPNLISQQNLHPQENYLSKVTAKKAGV